MSLRDPLENFPHLDVEQFCLASHSLHSDYIKATLGKQRRSFKLSLHRSFTAEGRPYDWLSILKVLDAPVPVETAEIIGLTSAIENLGWYGEGGNWGIRMDIDAENADIEALPPRVAVRNVFNFALPSTAHHSTMVSPAVFPSTITPPMTHSSIGGLPMVIPSTITPPIAGPPMAGGQILGSLAQALKPEVLYEIHLHPTYQVPTLWFTLNYLPEHEEPWNFVTVCRYLMSEYEYKKLQSSDSPFSISMSHHPITNAPAWFVHPCNTNTSLEGYKDVVRVYNYLRLWIGITGSCVGLHLPSAMIPREDQN